MLSDKEIKFVVEHSCSVLDDCTSSLIKYVINDLNDENSSRKKIISSIMDFQHNCIILCSNNLKDIYLDGYKKGYEDALLETSGLKNIVDKNLKKSKKR